MFRGWLVWIRELAEGRARQPGRQTPQEMAVGDIEGLSGELQVSALAAERERLSDRQVLVQLRRLPELRDGGREIAEDSVRRLHERVFIQIRAGLAGGIPIRIQQRLSGHEAASRVPGAKKVLPTADSDG